MVVNPDDIAIETLQNQSAVGTGVDKKIAFVPINTAGAADHRTAITVTSTAAQITLTAGKRTIEINNSGSNVIYYGGIGVDSDNGIPLFPNQVKPFANVKNDFSIYVVCATGETSTLRIVEFD